MTKEADHPVPASALTTLSLVLLLASGDAAIGETCSLEPFETAHATGYRDASGAVSIRPNYAFGLPFLETGIAAVVDKMGWAYIDCAGTVLIRPFVIDNGPDYFHEGLARFVQGRMIGFMNRSARIVVPARYRFAEPFNNGFALVCTDCRKIVSGEHGTISGDHWGVIDAGGSLVVPATHSRDDAKRLIDGLIESALPKSHR